MALAAVPGDPFRLGQTNTINNALTTLRGSNAGTMLTVDNDSAASGARALDLRVEPGKQPLNVNAEAGKAGNLNADKVDGKGADQIGVNGLERVFLVSDNDSSSPKSVVVGCPDGKEVIGTGAELSGFIIGDSPDAQTDVVLTQVSRRGTTQAVAAAAEEVPTADNWQVTAQAICATAGTP
jgi:hypothetical protein